MRASLVYHFKNFMSKIHPPLPLNPRETQKLVGLLRASHQKQLDEKHPESRIGWSEATDAHFHELLSSPLFYTGTRESAAFENRQSSQPLDPYQFALSGVCQALQEFDGSVAAGTMTLQQLLVILPRLVEIISKVSSKERIALLESSRAGEKIRHWLWASSTDECRDFLDNRQLPKLLAPLLIKKSHERFLWKWVNNVNKTLLDQKTPANCTSRIQINILQGYLIKQIVKRRLIFGNGASDACETFLAILHHFVQHIGDAEVRRKLYPAGNFLSHALSTKDTAKLEPLLFDAFVASCDTWGQPKVLKARLLLCHPKGPRPDCLMQFLRELKSQALKEAPQRQQYTILHLALKTATIALQQERFTDTEWLMEFAREHFPDETKVPSEVTAWSSSASRSDIARFASAIEELVLPISTALRLMGRVRALHDVA